MSLKTYIPAGIESEIERVRQGDSQISPSYFTTSLVRPTALSRNLQEVSSNADFDFSVVPLTLPTVHSTGDVTNSRAFDYDYLISNETDTEYNHFFIMDTGSKSWFVTFLEEVDDSNFKFSVHQFYENEPDLDLAYLDYKLLNTSNIAANLTSSVDGSRIKGYGIDFLGTDYELYITEEVVETEVIGEDNETKIVRNYFLTIQTERKLITSEKQAIKDINIVVAFKSDLYRSNIRVFNKLSYDPTLNDYYIYNNAERFESLKTFLTARNARSFDAFAGSLDNKEGLMFSIDMKYNGNEDFTDSLGDIKSTLGSSTVIMADNEYSLTGFQTLFYKVPDDDTSTVLSVDLIKVMFDAEEGAYTAETLRTETTTTNPVTWYDFFKEAGIIATVINKRMVTTRTEEIAVPGENPEDPPTTEEIIVEDVSYILKGFVLKVERSLNTDNETYLLKFTSNSTSMTTLGGSEEVTCLENNLEFSGRLVEVYPSLMNTDGTIKTFTIGYKNALNLLNDSFMIGLSAINEDFTVYKSVSNTLDKEHYELSSSVTLDFTSTPFFNLGYGISEGISNLKNFLSDIEGVTVESDAKYAELIVRNSNPAIESLYLKTDKEYKLETSSTNHLQTSKELLFQVDSSNIIERSFSSVEELPYIVVDMYNLEKLEIAPFSYITLNKTLLKEQDKAYINKTVIELPEDSEERSNYLKNMLAEFSTSLLSLNLLPIVPLLDSNNTFAECFAVFYDPTTIEGKVLENVFVKLNSNALLDDYSNVELKYQSGVTNAVPVYKELVLPESISVKDEDYFKLYSQTPAEIYGTSLQYSFDTEDYDVEFEVVNYIGNSLETISFKKDASESLLDQISNLVSDLVVITPANENTDIVTIKLKADVTDPRYSLRIKNTVGGDIVTSKYVHYISDTVCIIPLNKV